MAPPHATGSQEPVPPYSLAPLLFPTLPIEDTADQLNPASPAALHQNSQRAIRCSESDGSFLYIGTSDGLIHSFHISSRIPPQASTSKTTAPTTPNYTLKHSRSISNHAKPIEKIVLLRPFNAAAVLCEGVVSFFSLPDWSLIRSLPPTRAVSTVILDDEESEHGSGTDAAGMISICLVRRKNIILAKIGAEGRSDLLWATVKELPLPGGAIFARRFADTLCIANATEYSLVNLDSGHVTPLQLPISQTGESPSAQVRPSIVTIPVQPPSQREGSLSPAVDRSASSSASVKCEFLVTSHSGSITLGVFVKTSGEPAPKLLEWPSHPRSVTYDGKHLVSLLRNDTIEIHSLGHDSVDKVQTLQLPPGLDPRLLQPIEAPSSLPQSSSSDRLNDLDIVKVSLSRLDDQDTPVLRRASEHASSSSSSSQRQILLCGRNSTSSIQQDSLLSWTAHQLHRGRLRNLRQSLASYRSSRNPAQRQEDALRTSLESSTAHALLGIELLHRTDFVAAAEVLCHAKLDPRLFLALLPSLQQASQKAEEAIMPALVLSNLGKLKHAEGDQLQKLDDLVTSNLVLNYAPPLDVTTDKALIELHQQLRQGAERMLRSLLEAWRADSAAANASGDASESRFWAGSFMDEQMLANVNACVDSAYLQLIVERRGLSAGDNTAVEDELVTFLGSQHACESSQVEEVLKRKQYFSLLADHYENADDVEGALRTWTALIDGEILDTLKSTVDVPGALAKVASLLKDENDPTLLSTYGRWLVRKDPEAGIQVLTRQTGTVGTDPSQKPTTRSKAQELESIQAQKATINELRDVDADAATKYLEAVALSTTKVQDEQMHRELAVALLRRVEDHLRDDSYRRKMEAVAQDYAQGSYAESFFAHLALASDGSPREADRLKLAMLLQGSTVLDYESLLAMIAPLELLVYEKAIILGKLGRDSEALSLLAVTLRDANSAEAYCSQDGEVLSPMLASSIAEDHEALRPFAAMLSRTYAQRVKAHARATAQREVSAAQRKQDLLKQLLSVYMANGAEEKFRIATAHLLNTQALHLDSREVLELVPKDWSLQTLETFLSQSLRRQLHRRREMQMLRNIAKCRNLDVAEDLWARQRAMGGVLQDTDADGGLGGGGGVQAEEMSYADWKEGHAEEQVVDGDVTSEKKQKQQRQRGRQDDAAIGKEAIVGGVYDIPPSSAIVHAGTDDVDDLT
ncbi:related to TGF beta receptor associated protein-1 [Sporisorium reilianum SRZ2]|uniref:Related to TGF beta receptor associated protein-1 n=1 Tax=Sporisorium reilianum (strain SRZ2) TaxID=999809 RepID=E6ZXC5_SPORE|nr:related to TGF beta receptor associated protein-1 [Sporisorium reilianum SRZ2]